MMEKLATTILRLLDKMEYGNHDIDMLAWHLVNQSNRSMLKRLLILATSIMYHHDDFQENYNGNND